MRPLLLPLLWLLAAALPAQDFVALHSVTILPGAQVRVVWSKNFATCAHLRFSNAACTQQGALTHTANWFCASGSQVQITLPASAFVAGFGPGSRVYMVHGNNSGIASACVTVGCDGSYGAGCAGAGGAPVLDANCCPPAGTTMAFAVTNAVPLGFGVLGFGLGSTNLPFLGCTLLVDPVLALANLPFDASGAWSFLLPLPPAASGAFVHAQAYVLDGSGPQGFTATNGVHVTVL